MLSELGPNLDITDFFERSPEVRYNEVLLYLQTSWHLRLTANTVHQRWEPALPAMGNGGVGSGWVKSSDPARFHLSYTYISHLKITSTVTL